MYSIKKQSSGFTLLEMMVTVAILGVITVFSVGAYQEYIEEAEKSKAIEDITLIALQIDAYCLNNNGTCPDSLADVGLNGLEDPWGNPYVYFNIGSANGNGESRKLFGTVPINSDYDIYSVGPDGLSRSPLTARQSQDDIVRAKNGRYIGEASFLTDELNLTVE